MKPELVLVDGSSYLYRAYHALPAFTNSKGEPTGAIYGVVNMMRRLLQQYPAARIAVVFDAKGETFRDHLFADYKANRPPMPTELAAQTMPLHQTLAAMGLPVLIESGVEADDVIGTLATRAKAEGKSVLISSGDKDFAQLVCDEIVLGNTMTDTLLDTAGVQEKFGVSPAQIIDYLTLVGDSVDNVPGVPKCGPKTATKWLADYQTLDNLIAHAEEISGKVGENFRGSLAQLPLWRKLVTIHCDVSLPVTLNDLSRREPDRDALIELFQRFEFKTWLAELLDTSAETNTQHVEESAVRYELITTDEALNALIERLRASPLFAFDTETTSLDTLEAELVGLSFAFEGDLVGVYLPVGHDYVGAPAQLPRDEVLATLKPILEDHALKKVGQNLKYDMSVLANYGIALRGIAHDTMLESYVLDSVASRHDMDSLALKYLGYKTIHYEDIAGSGTKQISFNQIAIAQAAPYAAEDAEITMRLHQTLYPKLKANERQHNVYAQLEVPLISVLSRMERNGVLINAELLMQQSSTFADQIVDLEAQAHRIAGGEFNLASPKQIQEILFERMGLPVLKKTPTGQPSTAEDVLQELAEQYELPEVILRHRSLAKLKSTYTDKLPQQINQRTGRVHTSYHQAVAATGRLSSTDPNLQNIPIRSEEGRAIRRAFIAPPGYKIVAADYSQIELRILAHISQDESLLRAFSEGRDIHSATAAEVFGLPLDAVTSEQRRAAKAINFGLVYGMSAFGLARQLDVDRQVAQKYMDHYFQKYPGVRDYMERIRQTARDQGFVETILGRRLYLPEIKSSNNARRQYAERTAINAPMQGTAADIIKAAMIACDEWIGPNNSQVRMVMQVHDELVFEVVEPSLEGTVSSIKENMESAAQLAVPLVVDVGVGNNWDEAH